MGHYKIADTQAPHLAEILKGLAHPLRLQIISVLCEEPMCVNELCKVLNVKQAQASQHLTPLRHLGLVDVDRSGGKATYSLAEPQLKQLVTCLKTCSQ
ncbi:MAG: helix-turn-helix transcriptional regulator [Deltaproteobacteria bacterium]|nr:helix-turn-helix transcriptional regulator [Deltaproteobacteria bacterium]